jgi:hypothetical protein
VFPDYPAPVVRNASAEREMVTMRWGMRRRHGQAAFLLLISETGRHRIDGLGSSRRTAAWNPSTASRNMRRSLTPRLKRMMPDDEPVQTAVPVRWIAGWTSSRESSFLPRGGSFLSLEGVASMPSRDHFLAAGEDHHLIRELEN